MQPADDEPPRMTASMLRRAERMCRRRLAKEHNSIGKPNRQSAARFAVANRVLGDARLAHAVQGPPDPRAFVVPTELFPEQQRLYRAAVAGYFTLFADESGQATDLGWDTSVAELGIRLVGDVGLALEMPDGTHELRVLRIGGRGFGRALLDDVDLRFALIRTESWATNRLRIVAADLIEVSHAEIEPDLARDRVTAYEWLTERVALVRTLVEDGRERAGSDCLGCAFVAGCPAHAA